MDSISQPNAPKVPPPEAATEAGPKALSNELANQCTHLQEDSQPIATSHILRDLATEKEPETTALSKDATHNSLQRTISGPPYSIFTPAMKLWIISLVSLSAIISPFGATTFYPALNVLSGVLHVSPSEINISITTYMIAQAIAPSIIAGASDSSGRRLSFITCFIIFILANIGLALQTSFPALLVLRMVQASGCSAAIALSIAVVADVATSAERGKFMGYATAGLLFGPAFGPTIGGVLAQYLGWRSIFWFLSIYAGVLLVVFVFLFPETCRSVVGNGSIPAKGVNRSVISVLQQRRLARERRRTGEEGGDEEMGEVIQDQDKEGGKKKRRCNFPNPLRTLSILGEKESLILLLYNGLFFTGMMASTAAIPDLFKTAYNLDELKIGLCYIAMGCGSLLSALTMGHVMDWNFRRIAKNEGHVFAKGRQQDLRNFPIERVRLQVVAPGHVIGTLAYIAFGWTIQYRTSLAGPEVALFFVGFGVSTAFNNSNTLLIDLHRDKPASATAAVNFVRCLMSAGGSAAILPMCNAMGIGWAFTFIALVYVVLIVVVFWLMKNGLRMRQELAKKVEQKG